MGGLGLLHFVARTSNISFKEFVVETGVGCSR